MGREFSIYLDFVRFSAAVLVLMHHLQNKAIILADAPLAGHGHSAVMVFFVLSGYVIAYVTDTRESDMKSYAIDRCARIYSVALPAVLLVPLLDALGRAISPDMYAGFAAPSDLWVVRAVSSLLFTNELWFFSIMSFSNLPYWSLNYEVWYYILFAVMQFMSGTRRTIAICIIVLIMGPKILLLAPIWWLGVALYRSERARSTSELQGWALLILSVFFLALFIHFSVEEQARQWLRDMVGIEWTKQLVSSQFFISHYLLAVIVAMNFLAVRTVAPRLGWIFLSLERPIRFLASYTFTLYLFHLPLIWFFAAVYRGDPSNSNFYYTVLASVLAAVAVIGQLTEKRKNAFRALFQSVFDKGQELFSRGSSSSRIDNPD